MSKDAHEETYLEWKVVSRGELVQQTIEAYEDRFHKVVNEVMMNVLTKAKKGYRKLKIETECEEDASDVMALFRKKGYEVHREGKILTIKW